MTDEPGTGESKSSHLFNLPLTLPLFHDGSALTVAEAVDFYIRGGNHCERNGGGEVDCDSQIRPLRVRGNDRQNVIDLLEKLVDPRIAEGTGPWAHPSLELILSDGSVINMEPSDTDQACDGLNDLGKGVCFDR